MTCKFCGHEWKHVFKFDDLRRVHVLNDFNFICPKCGQLGSDRAVNLGKVELKQWKEEHPDLDIDNLPDRNYYD